MTILPVVSNLSKCTTIDNTPEPKEIGQWYWVHTSPKSAEDGLRSSDDEKWFGCITKVGSNFIELKGRPLTDSAYSCSNRLHTDTCDEYLEREPNPQMIIEEQVQICRDSINETMAEIRELTARIGMVPKQQIEAPVEENALTIVSSQTDVDDYKVALLSAQEQLPELFKRVKEKTKLLTAWMEMDTVSLQATVDLFEGSVGDIKDRIFTVSLYAGLTEQVELCVDGNTAQITDKIHLMQRRLYMDEECLLDYQVGGMEFKDIHKFDEWLARPVNFNRILPFPKCVVAMRVRREKKDRPTYDILDAFINIQLEEMDKATFLYIRNGEQLYRLNCDLDFGEFIFPDVNEFDMQEPLMVKMCGSSPQRFIPVREYEDMIEAHKEKEKLADQWEKENPDKHQFHNPFRESFFTGFSDWKPFNQDNVYFDECMKKITDDIKQYNRIMLIIQGLLDRSQVFHPHLLGNIGNSHGFRTLLHPVYDGTHVIANGEAPSFEEYRALCNSSITKDSVVTGQEVFWQQEMARKENKKYRNQLLGDRYVRTRFAPEGNPGPGVVSKIQSWSSKKKMATFTWFRGRAWPSVGEPIRTSIAVPVDSLFNISAYTPGDFKRFFSDPRTRGEYLRWAPMLLIAEEFYAGIRGAQLPDKQYDRGW